MQGYWLTTDGETWAAVESLLRAGEPRETVLLGELGIARSDRRTELLLRGTRPVPDAGYRRRTPTEVVLTEGYLAEHLSRLRGTGGLFDLHTHPRGPAAFSPTDDRDLPVWLLDCVFTLCPEGVYLRGVHSPAGCAWEVWHLLGRGEAVGSGRHLRLASGAWASCEPLEAIKVLSARKGLQLRQRRGGRLLPPALPAPDRHGRTLSLLGTDGPEILGTVAALTWGVIGLGRNGSLFVELAKHLGVRRWVLVDPDRLEPVNANGFPGYRDGDLGRPKVDIVRERLLAFDPAADVAVSTATFPATECVALLKEADVLVACPDNNAARLEASDLAVRYLKLLIECGSEVRLAADADPRRPVGAAGSQARLQVPVPGGKCLVCNFLDVSAAADPVSAAVQRTPSYIAGRPGATPASVIMLNAAAALLALELAFRAVAGGGPYAQGLDRLPDYLEYDGAAVEIRDHSRAFRSVAGCPRCGEGENSVRGWGDVEPAWLRLAEPAIAFAEAQGGDRRG